MHTISSYPGNRPTNKQTQPQTDRQDRLQYTAPQLACSVMTSFVDCQPSDIISLHCAHYALTHDTVPPGSGRGTSQRITNSGNGIQNMGVSYAFFAHQQIFLFDFLSVEVVFESCVTWATLPILVSKGLSLLELFSMHAADRRQSNRQTDVVGQTKASINGPPRGVA